MLRRWGSAPPEQVQIEIIETAELDRIRRDKILTLCRAAYEDELQATSTTSGRVLTSSDGLTVRSCLMRCSWNAGSNARAATPPHGLR